MTDVTVSLPEPQPGKTWKQIAQGPLPPLGYRVDWDQETLYDNELEGVMPTGFTVPITKTWRIKGRTDVAQNMVVEGTLVKDDMMPGATLFHHGIDESLVVGGGDDVVATDHGLWVKGRLLVTGSDKRPHWAWGMHPSWTAADTLLVAPYTRALAKTMTYTPIVAGAPVPEIEPGVPAPVLRISTTDPFLVGEPGKRSHIWIHSAEPSTIRDVGLDYVGQRKPKTGETWTQIALGRYPIHTHRTDLPEHDVPHLIENVLIRRSGNRGIVPHAARGAIIRNNLVHDVMEDGIWSDPAKQNSNENVNDTVIEGNCVSFAQAVPSYRGYAMGGLTLGPGFGNRASNNLMIAVQGNVAAAGYQWPEDFTPGQLSGVWDFQGNADLACLWGINVWQNGRAPHIVRFHRSYFPRMGGIRHGAYGNCYVYQDGVIVGAPVGIEQHALSQPPDMPTRPDRYDGNNHYGLVFERITMRACDVAVRTVKHTLPSAVPALYLNNNFSGKFQLKDEGVPGLYDIVDCNRDGVPFTFTDLDWRTTLPGVRVRIQNGTQAYLVTGGSVTTTAPFYTP